MNVWKRILKGFRINKVKKGFTIGWTTGAPFNPIDQERQDGLKDLVDQKKQEDNDTVDNLIKESKEE